MKLKKSILVSALFLAFAAFSASAAPAPEVVPADFQPVVETTPSDVFGASVLSQSADCGVAAVPTTGSDPWSNCGKCSYVPCKNMPVGSYCGTTNGQHKYCQDYLGMLCPEQDGVRCRCSSDPIP